MKFYSIQQDKKYTDWVAMLPMSEEKRLNLSYHIKRDTLWSDPHDISMKMLSRQALKSTVKYGSIHDWMQDTTIDMAAPPRSCKAIISPELRTLLQEFQGPEHGLYTMQMTNFYNDSDDERIYHLLHVKDQHYSKLLYNSIEFAVIDLADDAESRTYRTFQKGQIRSYETYQQIAAETADEFPGTYVKPLCWVYGEPWDFLWGGGTKVMVSENIKRRIEQQGLMGISFETFTQVEVITGAAV